MTQKPKIGIVYSPGYGAGWSTWGAAESALDQELAKAVEAKAPLTELKAIASRNWPGQYQGGLDDEGTLFRVDEYDGNESVEIGFTDYIAAIAATPGATP